MMLYQDARNHVVSFTSKLISGESVFAPRKKIQISKMAKVQEIMEKGGDEVSIFDLNELMGKFIPLNPVCMRILDNLRPAKFDFVKQEDLEHLFLEFAQMKITSIL